MKAPGASRRKIPEVGWSHIEAFYLLNDYNWVELGKMFDKNPQTIRCYAQKNAWAKRKAAFETHRQGILNDLDAGKSRKEIDGENVVATLEENAPAVLALRQFSSGRDRWKQRIAGQSEKVLEQLETKKPETIEELDGFVGVLEKTQKVGDSAYGLESETQNKVILNLAFLRDPSTMDS